MDDLEAEALSLTDLVTPVVLRIASSTGLLHRIAQEAVPVQQLAAQLGLPETAVLRIVRLLAARGVVRMSVAGLVQPTELGRLLGHDPTGPYATRLDWEGAAGELDRAFVSDCLEVVKGRSPIDVWSRFGEDERFTRSFDEMLRARSVEWIGPVVEHPVWQSLNRIVDLGGGLGQLVMALLDAWPQLQATLLERPMVVERLRADLGRQRHAGRLQVVGGDIFTRIPADADCYLLAHVLHDWNDAQAVRILTTARHAARNGRVIIVERMLPEWIEPGDPATLEAAVQDVRLYVLFGGGDRTRQDYRRLGAEAGLALESVSPVTGHRKLLIFRPVDN